MKKEFFIFTIYSYITDNADGIMKENEFFVISEWYWRCKVYFWVMRVCGVILAVVTFMVVWSECLFFVKDPILSLFAVFINAAKHNYDYVFIEVWKDKVCF